MPVAIGVAHLNPQGAARIIIAQRVGAGGRIGDIGKAALVVAALPLVAERPQTIIVGQRAGLRRQRLAFGHCAADRHIAGGLVIDIGHRRCRIRGQGFRGAVAIGVAHLNPQGAARIIIAQRVGAGGRIGDIGKAALVVAALPLVAERPQTIIVGQRAGLRRQRLAFGHCAADRHIAGGLVIDIGHRRCRIRGQGFRGAVAIGVAHLNPQGAARIIIAQRVGAGGRIGDIGKAALVVAALPLVAERPQTIIVGQRAGLRRQRLAFGHCAADRHIAGGLVIDIGHRRCRIRGQGFRGAVAIGVAHLNPQGAARIIIAQRVGAGGRIGDIGKAALVVAALPLVAERPQTIIVGQRAGLRRQRLAFGHCAADRHIAGGLVIDIGHRRCRIRGQGFRGAVAIGVAHLNPQGAARIIIAQRVGAGGRIGDIGKAALVVAALPLVAERPQTIIVGQRAGLRRQRLAFGHCAADRHIAGGLVIDIGHRRCRIRGQGFRGAVAIGVAHLNPQGAARIIIAQRVGAGGRIGDIGKAAPGRRRAATGS